MHSRILYFRAICPLHLSHNWSSSSCVQDVINPFDDYSRSFLSTSPLTWASFRIILPLTLFTVLTTRISALLKPSGWQTTLPMVQSPSRTRYPLPRYFLRCGCFFPSKPLWLWDVILPSSTACKLFLFSAACSTKFQNHAALVPSFHQAFPLAIAGPTRPPSSRSLSLVHLSQRDLL